MCFKYIVGEVENSVPQRNFWLKPLHYGVINISLLFTVHRSFAALVETFMGSLCFFFFFLHDNLARNFIIVVRTVYYST